MDATNPGPRSLWCIGSTEILPFNSTLKCEPLPDVKVAPRAASHRLNSLLFTNKPRLKSVVSHPFAREKANGWGTELYGCCSQIDYKQFCLYCRGGCVLRETQALDSA